MKKIFEKYNIELSKQETEKLEKFLEIFKEKNSQINLSAIRTDDAIIEKHFIDSIMLNIFIDLEGKGADLGTGGGFPGIPLAITNPKVAFTLIDSVKKKLKAINEFAIQLNLENIETLGARAEEIGKDLQYREQFDFVVSRATAYLPTLLEYTIPLLKVGGVFAAYKMDDKEELKASKKAFSKLGARILKVKNYSISGQKRTIMFIEKKEKTASKYPRSVGIPLQKPL